MAQIKSYTDLKQSKKLAEILPLESADMHYKVSRYRDECRAYMIPYLSLGTFKDNDYEVSVPSWSLAALFGVLPMIDFTTPQLVGTPKTLYRCLYNNDLKSHAYDNPIDACYEVILKLH